MVDASIPSVWGKSWIEEKKRNKLRIELKVFSLCFFLVINNEKEAYTSKPEPFKLVVKNNNKALTRAWQLH